MCSNCSINIFSGGFLGFIKATLTSTFGNSSIVLQFGHLPSITFWGPTRVKESWDSFGSSNGLLLTILTRLLFYVFFFELDLFLSPSDEVLSLPPVSTYGIDYMLLVKSFPASGFSRDWPPFLLVFICLYRVPWYLIVTEFLLTLALEPLFFYSSAERSSDSLFGAPLPRRR